jgi:hypothetical protein
MAPVTVMGGVAISSWAALSCVVDGVRHRHGRRDDIVMDGAYGALVGVRRRRHFTQILSGVDGLYTFPPSLCNQSVRVIRILVNSHVDLCLLSSTRVPRLSSAPSGGGGGVGVVDGVVDGVTISSWVALSWVAWMAPVTVVDGVTISSWTALSCVVDGARHRHRRRDDIVMDGAVVGGVDGASHHHGRCDGVVMDGAVVGGVDGASHRHGRRGDIVMDGVYGAVSASFYANAIGRRWPLHFSAEPL